MMRSEKGITLVALVITIIVMLILVAVSVTIALNGGLFTTAENAVDQTEGALERENKLDDGSFYIVNGESEEEFEIQNYVDSL